MATYIDAKEAYKLFLLSDFWIKLSLRKRRTARKCERCGSKKRLQSHHKFYRDNWFDTIIEDLECLCVACHRNHHGISEPVTEWHPDIPVPVKKAVVFHRKKKRRKRGGWKKRTREEARQIIESMKPVHPWHYNSKPSNRWSSRGSSSN